MPVFFRRVSIFFRCMLKISYSIPERFLHRHAWQIESISQSARLAKCFPRLWFPSRQRSRDMTLRLATGDSVDSSDAPVIRSRLNQLELLTGVRMMIRILSYEDHLIDSSDSPVIRYVPDNLDLLSEHCHIVIFKIILFAKSDPRQTLTKFTTIALVSYSLFLPPWKRIFLINVMWIKPPEPVKNFDERSEIFQFHLLFVSKKVVLLFCFKCGLYNNMRFLSTMKRLGCCLWAPGWSSSYEENTSSVVC